MADIIVGPGRAYTTISAAYSVAQDGDTIWVSKAGEPYNLTGFVWSKNVNLAGLDGASPVVVSDSSYDGNVISIQANNTTWQWVRVVHTAPSSWERAITIDGSVPSTAQISFVKCDILQTGGSSYGLAVDAAIDSLYVQNCHIQGTYSGYLQNAAVFTGELVRTYLTGGIDIRTGMLTTDDRVSTATPDYGVDYGLNVLESDFHLTPILVAPELLPPTLIDQYTIQWNWHDTTKNEDFFEIFYSGDPGNVKMTDSAFPELSYNVYVDLDNTGIDFSEGILTQVEAVNGTLQLQDLGGGTYPESGNRIAPALDLGVITTILDSTIEWTAATPSAYTSNGVPGYYTMDLGDVSGQSLLNSGNGEDALLDKGIVTTTNGMVKTAIQFDGSTRYNTNIDPANSWPGLTYAAWAKFTNTGGYPAIMGCWSTGFTLRHDGTNINVVYDNTLGKQTLVGPVIGTGGFNHYMVVVDDTNLTLYVNNAEVASATHGIDPANIYGPIFIGENNRNISNQYMYGVIDEVFILDYPATADDRNNLYANSNIGQYLPSTTAYGTSVSVETSLDGGTTWDLATNGYPISGIAPGTDMSGTNLLVRQTLTTESPDITPVLSSVMVALTTENPQYTNFYEDGTLQPNKAYQVQVRATNIADKGPIASGDYTYTTAITPNALTVTNNGDGSADISITNDDNAPDSLYAIKAVGGEYLDATGAPSATPVLQTQADWGTLTMTPANEGTYEYETYVQQKSDSTLVGPSTAVGFTTPPEVPTILTPICEPNGITWQWQDNSAIENNYDIHFTAGGLSDVIDLPVDTVTYTDTRVSPNVQYAAQIKASGTGGESNYSAVASIYSAAAVPPAPSPGLATVSTMEITPFAGTNPAGTQLVIYNVTDGMYVNAAGYPSADPTWQDATTWGTIIARQLQSGTAYEFAVKARNEDGIVTALSPTATAQTAAGISGKITEIGVPVSNRVVRLYNRTNGVLADEVLTNASGDYEFQVPDVITEYYVVALDDNVDPMFNLVGLDRMIGS